MSIESKLGDPRRRELDQEVLDWMRESTWSYDEARFDTLACELFRFQFEHCAAYARFCKARGVTPESVSSYREIPAVPTSAFKETRLCSFDETRTTKVFRTSGTTGQTRGALYLDTLALYESSLLPSIRRFVFPELEDHGASARMSIRVLASDPAEAIDSSLSHMFGLALRVLGNDSSGYDSHGGVLEASPLIDRLLAASTGQGGRSPIALCGTSFSFVHLLDALDRDAYRGTKISLPEGSRVMETGGFKGRSREVPRDELYAALEDCLGIAASHIVNQYGMTELGSQFYDSQLFESARGTSPGPRRKLGPPWARVRLIDPETGAEVSTGQTGMVIVHDLANTGSVATLQTEDLGRRVAGPDDGFEILGRASGAEARGCSIAADESWLEAQR